MWAIRRSVRWGVRSSTALKRSRFFGERVMVNAKIIQIEGFSGHADKKGLLEWIGEFKEKPKKVFITHGEEQVALSLGNDLKALGFDTAVPELGDVFDAKDSVLTPVVPEGYVEPAADKDAFNRALSVIKYYMSLNEPKSDIEQKRRAFLKEIEAMVDKWEIKG